MPASAPKTSFMPSLVLTTRQCCSEHLARSSSASSTCCAAPRVFSLGDAGKLLARPPVSVPSRCVAKLKCVRRSVALTPSETSASSNVCGVQSAHQPELNRKAPVALIPQ
eukprot:3804989-Pleurochrysis_carterae.AAC.1